MGASRRSVDVAPAGAANGAVRMQGVVRDVTYFGSIQKYMIAIEGRDEIEVDVDSWRKRHDLNPGDAVDLSWSDEAAVKLQPDSR